LLSLVAPAVQECCKQRTFSTCDGNGACNIFCCNCDGGCISPRLKIEWWQIFKRSITEESQADSRSLLLDSVDANGDGNISEEEGINFLMNGTLSVSAKRDILHDEWLVKMDSNGDGFIQPGEFDGA
ncbi:hypothetical protein PENTCL1PPCAC_18753, partial [Pristionchus entomophagus]